MGGVDTPSPSSMSTSPDDEDDDDSSVNSMVASENGTSSSTENAHAISINHKSPNANSNNDNNYCNATKTATAVTTNTKEQQSLDMKRKNIIRDFWINARMQAKLPTKETLKAHVEHLKGSHEKVLVVNDLRLHGDRKGWLGKFTCSQTSSVDDILINPASQDPFFILALRSLTLSPRRKII